MDSQTSQPFPILSQESGQIVNVDCSEISIALNDRPDPCNPLSVAGQTNEGVTMDRDGNLYVVNENGGGELTIHSFGVLTQ